MSDTDPPRTGRPTKFDEKTVRVEGTVHPNDKVYLKRLGEGNRSRGIRRAVSLAQRFIENSTLSFDEFLEEHGDKLR